MSAERKPRRGQGEPPYVIEGRLWKTCRKARGDIGHIAWLIEQERAKHADDAESSATVTKLEARHDEAVRRLKACEAELAAFHKVWTPHGFVDDMGWSDIASFQDPDWGRPRTPKSEPQPPPPPEPRRLSAAELAEAAELAAMPVRSESRRKAPVERRPTARPHRNLTATEYEGGAGEKPPGESHRRPEPIAARDHEPAREPAGGVGDDVRSEEANAAPGDDEARATPDAQEPDGERSSQADDDYKVGPGCPPRHTQFRKGEPSANRLGRPKGSKNFKTILKTLLDSKVPVRGKNGRPRKITLQEALLASTAREALGNNAKARAQMFDLINRYVANEIAPTRREKLTAEERAILNNQARLRRLLEEESGEADEPDNGGDDA